jgi:hypothetical protein
MVWEEENKYKNDEMCLDRSVYSITVSIGRCSSPNFSPVGFYFMGASCRSSRAEFQV